VKRLSIRAHGSPVVVDHARRREVVPVAVAQELEPRGVVEHGRPLGAADEVLPPRVGTRVEELGAHTGGIR